MSTEHLPPPRLPTAGPYACESNLRSTGFYVTAGGRRIAEVYERSANLSRDEAEANGYLLAASASLFAALDSLVAEITNGDVTEQGLKIAREALAAVRPPEPPVKPLPKPKVPSIAADGALRLAAVEVAKLIGRSHRTVLNLRAELDRGLLETNEKARPIWTFTADDVEAFRLALTTAKSGWPKGKPRESKPKAPWSAERRAAYEKTIARRQRRGKKKKVDPPADPQL